MNLQSNFYPLPTIYVKNNKGKVIILNGTRETFKMRQRGVYKDGTKVKPFNFISWKEMMDKPKNNVVGPFMWAHRPKL